MTHQALFDQVSRQTSRNVTRAYSTSFSMGIRLLGKELRNPIYAIYGFVRLADEIVDTFHGHDKAKLLNEFTRDTWKALDEGISLNPVLHSFQLTVRQYNIDRQLIAQFLHSMEMDLHQQRHDSGSYEEYILGSAEVVGLMCLKVFCLGDESQYEALKPAAMRLGAAFQKVNFLRDLRADYEQLGRVYFPGTDFHSLTAQQKKDIESDIAADFAAAYKGIVQLPAQSRFGVYIAYKYYLKLFQKIRRMPPSRIREQRVRIPNQTKWALLIGSYLRHSFNLL